MAEFTIKGFLVADVEDFAKSKGWQEKVIDDEGNEINNPITKGEYCKDYLRDMFRNDIKAYRLEQAKKAVDEPVEPNISVV